MIGVILGQLFMRAAIAKPGRRARKGRRDGRLKAGARVGIVFKCAAGARPDARWLAPKSLLAPAHAKAGRPLGCRRAIIWRQMKSAADALARLAQID